MLRSVNPCPTRNVVNPIISGYKISIFTDGPITYKGSGEGSGVGILKVEESHGVDK